MQKKFIKLINITLLSFLLIYYGEGNANSKVDGYKGIKFGMTVKELIDSKICREGGILENSRIYVCYDKQFVFKGKNSAIETILYFVALYTDETFSKYDKLLSKKYNKTRDFTSSEATLFDNGSSNLVTNYYADYAVALNIVRISEKTWIRIDYDSPHKAEATKKYYKKARVTSDDI